MQVQIFAMVSAMNMMLVARSHDDDDVYSTKVQETWKRRMTGVVTKWIGAQLYIQ